MAGVTGRLTGALTPTLTARQILTELVAIPTPSRVSNLPLLQWVAGYLEPRGWRIDWQRYVDDQGIEKANLIARPEGSRDAEKIDLAFVCHTDTVPYALAWAGALRLEERDGHLHGCGSCDVKGALACFLAAVSEKRALSNEMNVALILTADEEIGCKGMDHLLASLPTGRSFRIGSAIVSEPTSLRPGVAGKGYGLARVTVQGREAHSAFPRKGVSAISVAARLIAGIEDSSAPAGPNALPDPLPGPLPDPLFDPAHTTLNIGVIEGGSAKNIIAGQCTFLVEWRAIPGHDAAQILARLHAQVDEMLGVYPGVSIRIEALRAEAGFSPAASGLGSGPLQQSLASLLGRPPIGISFGSEASRLARIAEEVIVIGPGDMQTAHSDRECVPIIELESWTNVLRKLLCEDAVFPPRELAQN